jgi:DNA primase
MVKKSVLYWDFLIDSALSRHDPSTGGGVKDISVEVVPALAQITNSVMRAHYVTSLAKKLSIPEESIYSEIDRTNKKKELNVLKQTVSSIEKGQVSRRDELDEYLLSLVLQNFKQIGDLLPKLDTMWTQNLGVAKIIDKLVIWDKTKDFKIQDLVKMLPAELHPTLDAAYLRDLSRVEDPLKEWGRVVAEIHALYVRAELKKLASEIAEAEKKGEVTEELQARFADLSRGFTQ